MFRRKSLMRIACALAGVCAVATVAMGLLHVPAMRPYLAKLGFACPGTTASPQVVDRARAIPAAALAGRVPAPARPALGFELEKATLADIEQWSRKYALTCSRINGNETLRACAQVPAVAIGESAALPVVEEVDFEFRASGTLASVTVLRRHLAVPVANALTGEVSRTLRAQLGAPASEVGANSVEHFAKGPLQAYQEEYAYNDYSATITETRLGDTGLLVREQYFSALP